MWRKLRDKREARKLWEAGEEIALLSCNLRPGMMWQPCPVSREPYAEKLAMYQELGEEYPHSAWLDETFPGMGDEDIIWELMYNNWAYYNTDWERGYYAHYYVRA